MQWATTTFTVANKGSGGVSDKEDGQQHKIRAGREQEGRGGQRWASGKVAGDVSNDSNEQPRKSGCTVGKRAAAELATRARVRVSGQREYRVYKVDSERQNLHALGGLEEGRLRPLGQSRHKQQSKINPDVRRFAEVVQPEPPYTCRLGQTGIAYALRPRALHRGTQSFY
ncbi:hypothetical protein BDW22DRAFT_1343196 [Trametopsis cervina]|nr:hypothetical protein BDW22DRAFT_1343196 [Trametopsis cervina]